MNKIVKYIRYCLNYKKFKHYLYMTENTEIFQFYERHYNTYLKYAKEETRDKMLYQMIINYHPIEKGLAKADMRLGFGKERINALISLCQNYTQKYNDIPQPLEDAIYVITQYIFVHKQQKYDVDDIEKQIKPIVDKLEIDITSDSLTTTTKEQYFKEKESNFPLFARSRHSVRDFTGNLVNKDALLKAMELAQVAPSACNRQSSKAYIVYNADKRKEITDLQNGGRGFSDKANPIIVLTYNVQAWSWGEDWMGGYVDGGIYLMNLLYSLHYYEIGACPMNWYASIKNDKSLHKLLNIPDSEIVYAMIACGVPKNEFKLAQSKRLSTNTTIIEID